MTTKKDESRLASVLGDFGIDFPGVNFLVRNSLSNTAPVKIHEVDQTPKFLDPEIGSGEAPRRCLPSRSRDIGGRASTDTSGKLLWRLSNFVCPADEAYGDPVSFVATPLSRSPVHLTASVRSTGSDLVVEVFSWDATGAAAPRVAFTWRCWVEALFSGVE